VFYLEDSGEWPYLLEGGEDPDSWVARDPTANVEHLARTMERFGLGDRWMYRFPIEDRWYGLSDGRRAEVLSSADLLINVSGTIEHPERYRDIGCLVYVDSDPVFTQARLDDGASEFARRVNTHDVFFSFGESISEGVFATEHHWRPTRQPVVVAQWETGPRTRETFTTIMSWTSYPPVRSRGVTLGQKDVEFRRFLGLAGAAPVEMEVALGSVHHEGWETVLGDVDEIDPAASPADLLRREHWRVVDALSLCANMDDYRAYIHGSGAEWSVAKSAYVRGSSGWFSCRSACYLASGRPVVVQDTGFGATLPVGEGILAFDSPEQALEGIVEVSGNWDRHSSAAREIAEAHFDSGRVLRALLDETASAASEKSRGDGP
jgi:hypothetical protein